MRSSTHLLLAAMLLLSWLLDRDSEEGTLACEPRLSREAVRCVGAGGAPVEDVTFAYRAEHALQSITEIVAALQTSPGSYVVTLPAACDVHGSTRTLRATSARYGALEQPLGRKSASPIFEYAEPAVVLCTLVDGEPPRPGERSRRRSVQLGSADDAAWASSACVDGRAEVGPMQPGSWRLVVETEYLLEGGATSRVRTNPRGVELFSGENVFELRIAETGGWDLR